MLGCSGIIMAIRVAVCPIGGTGPVRLLLLASRCWPVSLREHRHRFPGFRERSGHACLETR